MKLNKDAKVVLWFVASLVIGLCMSFFIFMGENIIELTREERALFLIPPVFCLIIFAHASALALWNK